MQAAEVEVLRWRRLQKVAGAAVEVALHVAKERCCGLDAAEASVHSLMSLHERPSHSTAAAAQLSAGTSHTVLGQAAY